jgi:hypothetical protein
MVAESLGNETPSNGLELDLTNIMHLASASEIQMKEILFNKEKND